MEAIQRKLLTEADLTLNTVYEIAQGMEAAQKQASEFHAFRVQEAHFVDTPNTITKRNCVCCGKPGHPQISAISETKDTESVGR